METLDSGKVNYTDYVGDITVVRKGKEIRFGKPKSFDEETQLRAKQGLISGDRIIVGKKSAIRIAGHSLKSFQFILAFPDSEFTFDIQGWETKKNGNMEKGCAISRVGLARGIFQIYPADAKVSSDFGSIMLAEPEKEGQMYIAEVLNDRMVVIPGADILASGNSGKPYLCSPSFLGTKMAGSAELILTRSGMYERRLTLRANSVDERATKLSAFAMQFQQVFFQDSRYDESSAQYMIRKQKEDNATFSQNDYLQNMDVEKLKKTKGMNESQIELAKTMAEQYKKSGGSSSEFAINMLANLDPEKLKDLPGMTEEQRKQLEAALPGMKKSLQDLKSSGKLEAAKAQMKVSQKMTEAIATDKVYDKTRKKLKQDNDAMMGSLESLPPYDPVAEEFKVE